MPPEQTILIVDGDAAMRETLREQLTHDDAFAVVEAASAKEAEDCLFALERRFAAVIMEAVLPDGDGHAICARLRANGLSMPVILMNGLDRPCPSEDTTTIVKPFRLSELMARLRTQLDARPKTGSEGAPPAPIKIGPYEFNPDDKALRHGAANLRIRLTEKEAAILAFLCRMGQRAVPRRELLTEVWGYNPAVTTHTLETHIYRLRRKIEVDPAKACLLVTEPGGYRLAIG
ncbi:MAG: response regulator transcription factor [Acetobacteraceae bacterium]|jgi:DNA-binding response OmpR family regulator